MIATYRPLGALSVSISMCFVLALSACASDVAGNGTKATSAGMTQTTVAATTAEQTLGGAGTSTAATTTQTGGSGSNGTGDTSGGGGNSSGAGSGGVSHASATTTRATATPHPTPTVAQPSFTSLALNLSPSVCAPFAGVKSIEASISWSVVNATGIEVGIDNSNRADATVYSGQSGSKDITSIVCGTGNKYTFDVWTVGGAGGSSPAHRQLEYTSPTS